MGEKNEQESGVTHDFPPTPHGVNTQAPVVFPTIERRLGGTRWLKKKLFVARSLVDKDSTKMTTCRAQHFRVAFGAASAARERMRQTGCSSRSGRSSVAGSNREKTLPPSGRGA